MMKICEECKKEKQIYEFNEENSAYCNCCVEEKLDLINSLIPKVREVNIEDGFCNWVMVKADDETKEIFMQCGISESNYVDNIESSYFRYDYEMCIDLNIIGFKYGCWFIEDDGYYSYRCD